MCACACKDGGNSAKLESAINVPAYEQELHLSIGDGNRDLAVYAACPAQRRVDGVGPICGRHHKQPSCAPCSIAAEHSL